MDNAQKAIMIGVGLFITIIIIAAVMAITGMGTDLLNKGQSQLGGISGQLEQQLTADFDQKQMSGAQVLTAIQKYYTDPEMTIALYNTSAATTPTVWTTPNQVAVSAIAASHSTVTSVTATGTTLTANSPQPGINTFTKTADTNQIATIGQYRSVLIKNSNNVTIGIAFMRL